MKNHLQTRDDLVGCYLSASNSPFHRSTKRIRESLALFSLLGALILLAACESISPPTEKNNIHAQWNPETLTLTVSGDNTTAEKRVKIHDSAEGSLLGEAIVNESGSWVANSTIPACAVHVDLPDGTAVVNVKYAPENCTETQVGLGPRVFRASDIPPNVTLVANPTLKDSVPNAVILKPFQDISIQRGESVSFEGLAVGAGVVAPIAYLWDFGGAAPNSTIQNPGSIQFNTPGSYVIKLSASDNLGIPDPTPALRTITVTDPNLPTASAPIPQIISPSSINSTVTINVGESLFFVGTATDTLGSSSFFYEWSFSGAAPNMFGNAPGIITFSQAGTFVVNLYATDANGNRSITPASVNVVVNGSNGINQAPTGIILSPQTDVAINIGDSLTFLGLGDDPDLTSPLFYSWDFGGAAENINMSPTPDAGTVLFSSAGIFNIRFTVTDSLGVSDSNPPSRVVTVMSPSLPPLASDSITSQIISPPPPPARLKILPGEAVMFAAEIAGNINNVPLQYLWDFDGGAVNSDMLSPGNITFALPGKYHVTFYVMDDLGNMVTEPAKVKVKVMDPSKLEADIESPEDHFPIIAGIPVLLDGEVEYLNGATGLTFEWLILAVGSIDPIFTSTLQDPGEFAFPMAGEYLVEFKIMGVDVFGAPIERMDQHMVTVIDPPPATGTPPATPPAPANQGPVILSPAGSMTIPQGETISFLANSIQGTNIVYFWDFAGAAPISNLPNPPAVSFLNAGDFIVSLLVTGSDINGAPINLFGQRVITVTSNSATPNPPLTITGIFNPLTDVTISEGESVNFIADNVPASTLTYAWDFAGVAPSSTAANPAPIVFNTMGSYLISLQLTGTHATGAPINFFDQRVITVMPATGTPAVPPTDPGTGAGPIAATDNAPQGTIVEPALPFLSVQVGDRIQFSGAGFDPLGNGPLSFQWSFGGALTTIETQNPGTISFNQVGTHVVTLLVQNALGVFDPTPATVIITVTP